MTTTMHRAAVHRANGPPGRTRTVALIVIVSTPDLPYLLRQPNGTPVSKRSAEQWAQAAVNGAKNAVLPRPVTISGRPVWLLDTALELFRRKQYQIIGEHAAQIRAERGVDGPAVLVGIAEFAQLLGVSEDTISLRRHGGVELPAAAFTLGSPQAHAAGHKVSPVWVLADLEAAGLKVNKRVANTLKRTNLFDN